jgi:hypothetical protein
LYLGQGRGARGLRWVGVRVYFQDHLITN